jgi:LuxR family maltose regulon positive regulatory protein
MSTKTPRVWEVYVEDPERPTVQIRLDRPEWFAWLELATTRRFCYPVFDARVGYIVGFMTVRKERRARGGQYWVAYRRCQGRLRRVYLGASVRLTREALERQAQAFLAASTAPSSAAHSRDDGGFQ